MKKLYYSLILFGAAICGIQKVTAQDLHFSQFHETPLYRNPALAGIMNGDIRVQTVFRSQWNSIANAYKTGSFNIEYKTKPGQGDDYMTWGLMAYYDRAGTTNLTSTILMPAINFHKSMSEYRNSYLSAAFMGGFVQRRFDRSKMTTNNQYENGWDGESEVNNGYTYWDGSAGLSYNTSIGEGEKSNLVLGVAYHHFNRPTNSFFNASSIVLDPKLVFSADMKLDLNEYSTMTIYSDFVKQGTNTEIIGGMLYGLKVGPLVDEPDYVLHGGAFLRWGDAIIPTVKLDYRSFSAGISYDVNISKLAPHSVGQGGFELSVTYRGFLDKFNSTLDALRCPRF
jgi:type IX secretion system PorP/SprF family membrane protein